MITVNILYPNKPGSRFDFYYYLEKHMPLSLEKLGGALRGASVEQGITGVPQGTPAPYIAQCHLRFDSAEAFLTAFMPHAELLQGDMKNYTDIEPVIQISEVRISR